MFSSKIWGQSLIEEDTRFSSAALSAPVNPSQKRSSSPGKAQSQIIPAKLTVSSRAQVDRRAHRPSGDERQSQTISVRGMWDESRPQRLIILAGLSSSYRDVIKPDGCIYMFWIFQKWQLYEVKLKLPFALQRVNACTEKEAEREWWPHQCSCKMWTPTQ